MSFSIKNINNDNKTCLEECIDIKRFSDVRLRNKKIDKNKEILGSLIGCYIRSEGIGINKDVHELAELLCKNDLEIFCEEVFLEYIKTDIFEDKKWVINFCGIHGGERIISKMEGKIYQWICKGKISIALDAIVSLSLNGSKDAFRAIEKIQRTCKNEEVKVISEEAINFAIDEFNMDKDAFYDDIVPNLGLDERGICAFEYNNYKIYIYLIKLFKYIICDENHKLYKTLPKVKDSKKEQNIWAKQYFKEFRVQLQKITYRELERIEIELSNNRKWPLDLWINTFLKNPIMRTIGESFIWGIYHKSKIQSSMKFSIDVIKNNCSINILSYKMNASLKRYEINNIYDSKNMMKISNVLRFLRKYEFNNKNLTSNIDDYTINLVHPVELKSNQLEIWKEEFEKYNILQPIDQLYRINFIAAENELENEYIDRFYGKIIKSAYIVDRMNRFGWYKGNFNSDGRFYGFYKENINLKIVAELKISGISLEQLNEDTEVYLLRFYRINDKQEKIEIDNVKNEELLKNYEIPKRFFSEILYDITNSLFKSVRTDYSCREDIKFY